MNINNIPIQKYLVELEMVVKYGWFNLANENLHLQFLQITSQNFPERNAHSITLSELLKRTGLSFF